MFKVGTPVTINEKVEGVITAVLIRGTACHVSYEVSWWDGATNHCKWLDECVGIQGSERMMIGFKN